MEERHKKNGDKKDKKKMGLQNTQVVPDYSRGCEVGMVEVGLCWPMVPGFLFGGLTLFKYCGYWAGRWR